MTKHKSIGTGIFAVVAVCLAFTQTAQCMGVVTVEGCEASLENKVDSPVKVDMSFAHAWELI